MNKRIISAVCLAAVMTGGIVLASCHGRGSGDETKMTTGTTETTGTGDITDVKAEELPTDKPVTLSGAGGNITLSSDGKRLLIDGMSTAAGKDVVSGGSEYSLPYIIKRDSKSYEAEWELSGISEKKYPKKTEVTFEFTDKTGSGAILRVGITAHTDVPGPFEFVTTLENTRVADIRINPGDFASAKFSVGSGAKVMAVKKESGQAEGYTHDNGGRFDGTGIYTHTVNSGLTLSAWCNTNQDWNGSGYLPMVYMQGEERGAYMALEWSSGTVFVQGYGDGSAKMSVNMDGVAINASPIFSTVVPGKETFLFPTVYIGGYDGNGFDDGSNCFKKWFMAKKAPANLRDDPAEPLTQMDMQVGLGAAELNVDAIKWDYGWWSNDARGSVGNWTSYEGSWKVRSSGYLQAMKNAGCVTLKRFTSKAKTMDLSLTLYVLLHDTLDSQGKVTAKEGEFNSISHPSWFSDRRIDSGMGRSADLGNEECVAFLQKKMAEFFGNNGVRTWRSDFEPISRTSNLKNRHDANGSDVQYWCTVGFKELASYLIENVEGFRYESCSSGGSMKDLFTATLATVINCDDAANYLSMRMSFYDSSYVIHPTQLQLPCNMDQFDPKQDTFYPKVTSTCTDSDYDFRDAMLDMGFRTQMLGVPMYSSWKGKVLKEYLKEYSDMYEQKIRPLVRDGGLYHILPRPDGVNWDGVMYADPDSANGIKGAVFLFKPSEQAENIKTVKFAGLDPAKTYKLTFEDRTEQNTTASGSELMEKGLAVMIKSVGSEIIWITEG